ncbi:hypothetical protein [uncultured Fusobacterium sp.]|uniref:hypothetical protein n=1 Tax=uncultured Fusobacterium sp. TaxID=159267 RepID=UPI002600D558|nr:hypothetical protein [uncultured Fusobacterium sp.]
MNFVLKFLNNPYILALNSILTVILAFFTIRDKYLTFPHFRIDDLKIIFFKEGVLSVEFEIINTSQVPFSLKSVSLNCKNKTFSPIKMSAQKYFYSTGEVERIVTRKRDKNFAKQHIDELKDFTLQYGEYKKVAFLFSTDDPELLSKQPVLSLVSRSKKKKIKLSGNPVDML